jgi:hypothetical protein
MESPKVVLSIAETINNTSDYIGLLSAFVKDNRILEYDAIRQALLAKTSVLVSEIANSEHIWGLAGLLMDIDLLTQQPEIQDALRKRGDDLKQIIESEVETNRFGSLAEMYPKWKKVREIVGLNQKWLSNLVIRALGDERNFDSNLLDLGNLEDVFQRPLIRKQILESLEKFDLERLFYRGMKKYTKGIPSLYIILRDPEFAERIQKRVTELAGSWEIRQIVEADGFIDAFSQSLSIDRRAPHLFFYDFKNIDLLTRSEDFAEHLVRFLEDKEDFWYETDPRWLTNPIFNTKKLEDVALRGILENKKPRLWISAVACNRTLWESDSIKDAVMESIENGIIDPYMVVMMLLSEHMLKSEGFLRSITRRLMSDEALKLELVKHLDRCFRSSGFHDLLISNVPAILEIPEIEGKLSGIAAEIAFNIKRGQWQEHVHTIKTLGIPFFASHARIVKAFLETIKNSSTNRRKAKDGHLLKDDYEILESIFLLLSDSPILMDNTDISEHALNAIKRVFQDLDEPLFAKKAIDTIKRYPYSISTLKEIRLFQKILVSHEYTEYSKSLLEKFTGPHLLEVLEDSVIQLLNEANDKWRLIRCLIPCGELLKSPRIKGRIVSFIERMVAKLESGESLFGIDREHIISLAKSELLSEPAVRSLIGIRSYPVLHRADRQSDRKEICDFLGRIEGHVDLQANKNLDSRIVEILLQILTEGENKDVEVKHLINLLDSERRKFVFEIYLMESNSLLSILKHGQREKEFRKWRLITN